MKPIDAIEDAMTAGLSIHLWPKNLTEYYQEWRRYGNDDYLKTDGAIAFKIYARTSTFIGESDELRDAVYLAVLGELESIKARNND